MPGTVYSTRILFANQVGLTEYHVPAGKRAVVKGMNIVNLNAATYGCSLYLNGVMISNDQVPGQRGVQLPTQMIVAFAGERLGLSIGAVNMNAQVSGYLLDDSTGRTELDGVDDLEDRDDAAAIPPMGTSE